MGTTTKARNVTTTTVSVPSVENVANTVEVTVAHTEAVTVAIAEAVEAAEVPVDLKPMMMDSLCTILPVSAVDSNPEASVAIGDKVESAEADTTTEMERATTSSVETAEAAEEAKTGLHQSREKHRRQHQKRTTKRRLPLSRNEALAPETESRPTVCSI